MAQRRFLGSLSKDLEKESRCWVFFRKLGAQGTRESNHRKNEKTIDKLKGLKTRVRRSVGPYEGMEIMYAKVLCGQGCDLRTSLSVN